MTSILQAAFTSAALFVLALSATAQSAAPPPAASTAPPAAAEPPSAGCTGDLVTSKIDRFSGVTLISTVHTPGSQNQLVPDLMLAGTPGQRFAAELVLSSRSESWRHLSCYQIDVLADGKAVAVGRTTRDGTVYSGMVREEFSAELNAQAIAQLGTANKIEFKVCNDEFQASEEFVRAAHEFACKDAERFGAKPAQQP